MFDAALFTITSTKKQPRCPSTVDKKVVVHIYTGVFVIKWNTFESVLMRWMNTEPIIQSKVSQKVEKILYFNPYIWNLER